MKPIVILSGLTFLVEFSIFWYFAFAIQVTAPVFWSLLILLFLSLYQLSETIACGFSVDHIVTKFGHVIITFLPPFGLFLIHSLGIKTYFTEYISILLAIYFSLMFLLNPKAVKEVECTGKFIKYEYMNQGVSYGIYYNGFLLIAVLLLSGHLFQYYFLGHNPFTWTYPPFLVLLGYLSFTVPTTIQVYKFKMDPRLVSSVMCQWAFLLALTLYSVITLYVS